MSKIIILGPDPVYKRALTTACSAPVTILFMACCVALFAIAEHYGSTQDVAILIRFGATERGHVWAGEVWRTGTVEVYNPLRRPGCPIKIRRSRKCACIDLNSDAVDIIFHLHAGGILQGCVLE